MTITWCSKSGRDYLCSAVSKSAQKNRRKKQQQQRSKQQQQQQDVSGQSQEQRDAVSMAAHLMGGASEGVRSERAGGAGDAEDREKKIKNLKKVCGDNFQLF